MGKKRDGGVNISNSSVNVQGDIVGRDKIINIDIARQEFVETVLVWENQMKGEIEKLDFSPDEKSDLLKQLELIKSVLVQDKGENRTRLEKLINTIAVMSPDIFDVIVATLVNPLAGIGLTLRKISDKAKLESLA